MFGYCFVFCAASSAAVSAGPKLRGCRVTRRDGCDGGRNLSGFASTGWLGLRAEGDVALVAAYRHDGQT